MSHQLMSTLLLEVFQAERSGAVHARREAERLSGSLPAQALHDLADDCMRALDELRVIAVRTKIPIGTIGERIGDALSAVRHRFADLLLTRETSFRATLLGVHHGMDAIQLLLTHAEYEKDVEVVEWCMRTLDRRRPLLSNAQHELSWFGHHPDLAMQPAKVTLTGKAARVVAMGFGVRTLRAR